MGPHDQSRREVAQGNAPGVGDGNEMQEAALSRDHDQFHDAKCEAESRTNWGGNLTYGRKEILFPRSLEGVISCVKSSPFLRPVGTRHSFSRIADSFDTQISLKKMVGISDLDAEAKTVTIAAGTTYSYLAPVLHRLGYGLANLASLPHISVAGAMMTATHGSGDRNQSLASAVVSFDMVTAEGELVRVDRRKDPELFEATVVSLGALGIVVNLTLQIEPSYQVSQQVFRDLPFEDLFRSFDTVTAAAYSVSLFTTWQREVVEQVWVKSREREGTPADLGDLFGLRRAEGNLHPVEALSAQPCTPQMAQPGPWYERLPHFVIGGTPSAGNERQTEFIFPRARAVDAMRVIAGLRATLRPALLISEIRTIAADNFWMSPFYQRDSVGIHFTWNDNDTAVAVAVAALQDATNEFNPRPHWGKIAAFSGADLRRLYPRLEDFCSLRDQFDPDRKFSNPFLEGVLASGTEAK